MTDRSKVERAGETRCIDNRCVICNMICKHGYGELRLDSQAHADEAAACFASAFFSDRVFLSTFDALGPRFAADSADKRASADYYEMYDEQEG